MRTTSAFRYLPIAVVSLVQSSEKWSFDPEGDKQEIMDHRVGKYELDTPRHRDAQDEYAMPDLSKSDGSYARKFISLTDKQTDSSSAYRS